MKPIRVGLQFTFLINNLEFFVSKVKTINGAADEGSPGIFILKLFKFCWPLNVIKFHFFNFLILISA